MRLTRRGRAVATTAVALAVTATGLLVRTPLDTALREGGLRCHTATQTCTTQPHERP